MSQGGLFGPPPGPSQKPPRRAAEASQKGSAKLPDHWLPWGWVPRAYAELGTVKDDFGGFRLLACNCLVCQGQFAIAEPSGTRATCPRCGAELQRVSGASA